MTRSPARMTTPPISESSTAQSSVTFVPRRFSIAATMVVRCGSESSNALVTWTWLRPSRAARSSANLREMSGSNVNRPYCPTTLTKLPPVSESRSPHTSMKSSTSRVRSTLGFAMRPLIVGSRAIVARRSSISAHSPSLPSSSACLKAATA